MLTVEIFKKYANKAIMSFENEIDYLHKKFYFHSETKYDAGVNNIGRYFLEFHFRNRCNNITERIDFCNNNLQELILIARGIVAEIEEKEAKNDAGSHL